MKRLGALGLAALLPFLLGAVGPQATVRIEVRIPERAAMWLEGPDLGPGGSLGRFLWAGRGGGSPAQPPYCPRNPLDPSLCLRDPVVVFDLRCATLGPVPPHCAGLYGGDGRFLDEDGRPYPPYRLDGEGRVVPGSKRFPQFFVHPSMRLHVFTQSPAGPWRWPSRWSPRARKGRCWTRATSPSTPSSRAGAGCPPRPTGSAWPTTRTGTAPFPPLPSPRGAPGGVLLEEVLDHPGGWQSVTLGIKLRLDGSEVPGEYEGQLVYTLTLL